MSVIAVGRDLSRGSGAVIDARGRRARRGDARAIVGGCSGVEGAVPATWTGLIGIVLALLARLALGEIGQARVALATAATPRKVELAPAPWRVNAPNQTVGAYSRGGQRM